MHEYPPIWAAAHECLMLFCTWVAAHAWVALYEQLLVSVIFSAHEQLLMHEYPYIYIWAAAHDCHFFCTWVAAHAWVPLYIYIYIYIYIYVCIYIYMYVCICIYIYICMYMYIYMCVCVCIWAAAHEWMPKSFSRTNTPIPGWRRWHMKLWIWEGGRVEHLG